MALEEIGYQSPEGCIIHGRHVEIVASGSTEIATARQAGATLLLDTAAGTTITLPAPVAGMVIDVEVSVSVTSNNHVIKTNATSTVFLGGAVQSMIAASATTLCSSLNGTSHSTITMNGTTTGGLIGTRLRFVARSATVWGVSGLIVGSGALATPVS